MQALINNGAGAGWYRPLDVHEAYAAPLALHITPQLARHPVGQGRSRRKQTLARRPRFEHATRSGALWGTCVRFTGTTYSDHILPYFPAELHADQCGRCRERDAAQIYRCRAFLARAYPPERVLNAAARMSDHQAPAALDTPSSTRRGTWRNGLAAPAAWQ
jgi:hypothetical protein